MRLFCADGRDVRCAPLLKVSCVVLLTAGLFSAAPVSAQNGVPGEPEEDHSPRGALWRAAIVPGWGQLYNRQYYKIPVVWAGLGGLTATALYVNQRYLLYRHSYHFLAETNVSPEYAADFRRLINDLGITEEQARQRQNDFRRSRDILRRNRDLLYIGIGLFYGLSILDAYVNAHLLDFDIGEDLTLTVEAGPTSLSAAIRLRP